MVPKTERRKRVRPKTAPAFPRALRAHLIEAAKVGTQEALDNFAKEKQAFLDGLTAQDHIADHQFVAPWRRFWERMNANITEGFWKGVGQIIRWGTFLVGVTVLLSFVGSAMSQNVRQMVGQALKFITP